MLAQLFVLGSDGNLWLEFAQNGAWGQVPPQRQKVDGNVADFWPVSASGVYTLGKDGNLWFEYTDSGTWNSVPPTRKQVDGQVKAFQPSLTTNSAYILGTDGNLWFANPSQWGQVPPLRRQVDANAAGVNATNAGPVNTPFSNSHAYVVGTDGTLWLESASNGTWGSVPPPKQSVHANVVAFAPLSASQVFVLDTDHILWLESAADPGQFPGAPQQIDGNVAYFQPLSPTQVVVLDSGGNLWLESAQNGRWGQGSPSRQLIDRNVAAFEAFGDASVGVGPLTELLVLGSDGNLWLESAQSGHWGQVPPPRQLIDGNVIDWNVIPT